MMHIDRERRMPVFHAGGPVIPCLEDMRRGAHPQTRTVVLARRLYRAGIHVPLPAVHQWAAAQKDQVHEWLDIRDANEHSEEPAAAPEPPAAQALLAHYMEAVP